MRLPSTGQLFPWAHSRQGDFKDRDIDLHLLSPTSSTTELNVVKSDRFHRKGLSSPRSRHYAYLGAGITLFNVLLLTASAFMFHSVRSTRHSCNSILKQSSYYCTFP